MYEAISDKRTSAVDIFKLFFAICIMTIHTRLFKRLPEHEEWLVRSVILRMGVPYFFISSGYFYWKKTLKNISADKPVGSVWRGYINRNIRPFLFFSTASLLFHSILSLYRDGMEGMMLTIHNAIFYPLGAMWFVLACMVAVVILTKLKNHKRLCIIIGCVGYAFALLCNTYYFLVEGSFIGEFVDLYLQYFVSARNGLFLGVFLIGIGACIAENENSIHRIPRNTVYLLLAVAFALQIAESLSLYGKTIRDDASLFIAMPWLAAIVFIISLQIKMPYSMGTSIGFRRLSGYIYFLHPLFNVTIGTIILITTKSVLLNTLIVFACCMVAWFLTQKSENKMIRALLP